MTKKDLMPKPKEIKITIGDLVNKYEDNTDVKPEESGPGEVFSMPHGKKLIIRPPYQRNFIYDDKERSAVIETISKGFPLNVMYWGENEDGDYEMIDGQQRTISICQYVEEDSFFIDNLFKNSVPQKFSGLSPEDKKKILDYPLMVFLCKGNEDQRLDWFQTINIAGKNLSSQELLNAIYRGTWTTGVKELFGGKKTKGYKLGRPYVDGRVDRQDFVATALSWSALAQNYEGKDAVKKYMGDNKNKSAKESNSVYEYFDKIIKWVQFIFLHIVKK